MPSRNAIFIGSTLAVLCAATAHGQTAWNRKVEAMTITPNSAGNHDIVAFFEVSADSTPTTLDLSTEVEILVNGTTVSVQTIGFDASPAELSGCGTSCLAFQQCICCEISPGNVICTCGGLIAESLPSESSLEPGDEIMVLLRPAPGALPDIDTSDDTLVMTYHGDDIYWNRKIFSAEIVPASGGGGPAGGGAGDQFFDVWVETGIEGNYDGLLHLPAEVELQINGVPVATSPVAELDLDLAWTQCSTVACNDTVACVITPGYFGSCQPDLDGPTACACQYHPVPDQPLFPLMILAPDDEITIILRPVPGALPELPGFPDDDEANPGVPQPCLGDLDGDGWTNVVDLLALLGAWGPCPQPCPPACLGDTNGDCNVNVVDLLELLAAWGPCGGPV